MARQGSTRVPARPRRRPCGCGRGRWTTDLAPTIDDGADPEVVGAFIAMAAVSGARLTFFPNGCYRSWEDNAWALQPLVDSGQIALGNHTWLHQDLGELTTVTLADAWATPAQLLRGAAATGQARSS